MKTWENPMITELEINATANDTWNGCCWDGAYLGDGNFDVKGYYTNDTSKCENPFHDHSGNQTS